MLPIERSPTGLRAMVAAWRADGARVALVPTMGALHDGHAALIRATRAEAERVVVSIFVNPRQFGPNEDFDRYPPDEAADVTAAARAGADLVYAPAISAMYPSGYATTVSVAGLSEGLCGAQRPGHFDGMATVVTKLLLQAGAGSAWFGEKDYQQWLVVRRLVADLDIPVRLRAVPTVREADGLALSSRNRFLSPGERAIAPRLAVVLHEIATRATATPDAIAPLLAEGHAVLTAAGFKVEYLEIRDAETLAPCTTCRAPARVLAAVRLGSVRLIDNWPIPTAAQRA
ncbi:pantoate--beta-alanine ligase [Acidibrevibacterium fodinaquatile]|uniref:pantoate--beta-alanine ligase n=1 Tax=Acidibrevibacterium fodinaquatile TaxID=1969806 RepID=UPI000E0DBED2|nr:pantoate--beta-alanine ligase [Acidibrevibacterium fodinaquatile]